MMTIEPREKFIIVRQLPDPSDSSTYYVRAVIRNAMTDAVIGTVNLTDQGSRRFSREWQAPADVSGQGFYIAIATTVYTDSGYTTKSEIYAEEMATHLIAERYNPRRRSPSSETVVHGGDDVNYKKIRQIIKEEIEEYEKREDSKETETEKPDHMEHMQGMIEGLSKAIIQEIKGIKFPEQKDQDDSKVIAAIKDLKDTITEKMDSIEIPEFEKTDLTPILNKLENMNVDKILAALDSVQNIHQTLKEMRSDMPELESLLSEIESKIKDFLFVINTNQSKVESKPDYSDRAKQLAGVIT